MKCGADLMRQLGWLSAMCLVCGWTGRLYAQFDPNDFPPQAVLVTNEAELRAAAALTENSSLTLLVAGTVAVNNDTVVFPSSTSIVKLIGIGDDPTIEFNLQWPGWGNPPNEVDGLRFESRQAIVHNLTFKNYNHRGGAIRATGPANGDLELLSVSNCTFKDIGTTQFDHAIDPSTGLPYTEPTQESQVVFNHCILATGHDKGHVAVEACTFENDILNNRQWSRCLRVTARSVHVFGNTFTGCGQPFDLGGAGSPTSTTVFENTVLEPALVDDNGILRRPAIATLEFDDHAAYMFNVFAGPVGLQAPGEVYTPWIGNPNPQRHLIDHNDYGDLKYEGSWAGGGVQWSDWTSVSFRFDTHSVPPQHPLGVDPGTPAIGYPPSTVLVTNESELQSAGYACWDRSLNVLLSGTITIQHGIEFRSNDWIARIVGVSDDASIDMDLNWIDWETEPLAVNGIRLKTRQAVVHNLTVKNYDHRGASIRGMGPYSGDFELMLISKCNFLDIGTTQFDAAIDPETGEPDEHLTSTNTVINSAISAFAMDDCHLCVTGCDFQRCQLNNVAWSHCMYISARSIDVRNNTFMDCGNPFSIGALVAGASNNVFRNTVIHPAYIPNRHHELVAAWYAMLHEGDFDTYMFNTIDGTSQQPFWAAPPGNEWNYVDFNDYSGMRYYDFFFGNPEGASGFFDDWNQIWKFDIHSSAPQHIAWPESHVVNVTADHGSIAVAPNALVFPIGYNVSLTVQPDPGFEFTTWSGDAAGNEWTITLTMNGDKNIVAVFSQFPTATGTAGCGFGAWTPLASLTLPFCFFTVRRRRSLRGANGPAHTDVGASI